MLLPQLTLILCLVLISECQVKFPSSTPRTTTTPSPDIPETCTASNGVAGTCHEFRSNEIKECSFFPSMDTSKPDVAKHLTANTCINTGRKIYFCCPEKFTLPTDKECAISINDNVVGGQETKPGQWPWLVALLRKNDSDEFDQFCGGTLITKQHVLTAAHCFNQRYEKTIIRVGEYDLDVENDGAQDFKIIDERFSNYNKTTKENDIMLLKLDRPVDTTSDSIGLACLPQHIPNENFEGKKGDKLVVVGWGTVGYHRNSVGRPIVGRPVRPPIPFQGTVPSVPLQECQEEYKNLTIKIKEIYKIERIFTVDDRQFCAGIGGTDSCQGDSGGPIHYLDLDKSRLYVIGVVSFGPTPCGEKIPGVYTRIGNYLDWIRENIN